MAVQHTSGVYAIVLRGRDQIYIGSSSDVAVRWSQHRTCLLRNEHHSPRLQNAWNKYGAEAFDFIVLEECDSDRTALLACEQIHIDILSPVFNVCRIAGSRKGSPQSAEARAKVADSLRGIDRGPEWREKMRQVALARLQTPEGQAQIAQACLNAHTASVTPKRSAATKQMHLSGQLNNRGSRRTPEQRARIAASKLGIRSPHMKVTDEQLLTLHGQGLSSRKIAPLVGIASSNVRCRLHKLLQEVV